jgi:hypothetical protein
MLFKEKTIMKICIDCRNGDCDSCYEHDCPCNLAGHRKPIKEKKRPALREACATGDFR